MPTGEQGAAVAGFVPWITYWVVADSPSTWLYGALCAVISAVILGVSVGRGGLKLLDVVTIVFFTGITTGVVVHATVPPQRWNDPTFKRTHRMLTLMWGLVFGATAVLGYVAVKAPATEDWTDWVVPIVLIMAAIAVSQRFPSAGPVTHQP